MSGLLILTIPVVIVLFVRSLLHGLFPWLMRPLEWILKWLARTGWGIVWTKPAHRWGGFNIAWLWSVIGVAIATVDGVSNGRADAASLVLPWIVMGAIWWGLRVLNRWRLRPHGLPRRHRGGE